MHCICQMHKVIGSEFNMNILSELVEINTKATPPSYQRDKVPFSQIKSKSGRYKRKVKVGEFLRKMCSYMRAGSRVGYRYIIWKILWRSYGLE